MLCSTEYVLEYSYIQEEYIIIPTLCILSLDVY